jgi:TPR repeat protein
MYRDGRGVARDDAQAAYWFRKSALQGNDWGQYYLGMMYHEGRGIGRDDALALYWLHKAAEQGLELAREEMERLQGGVQGRTDGVADASQAELFSPPPARVRRFPPSSRIRANARVRQVADARQRRSRTGRRSVQYRHSAQRRSRHSRRGENR